jgi:hypothetical protein
LPEAAEGEQAREEGEGGEARGEEGEGGLDKEPEALAEDFSDFGDSDDEILNQDDGGAGGGEGGAEGRPGSGGGASPRGRRRAVREGREGPVGEAEELVASNARLADALGADWSLLLRPKEEAGRAEGDARRRWSGAQLFARIGLSKVGRHPSY